MSYVKLSFKNRDPETYEVAGSVKVEVPTAANGLLSYSFHPESLLAVEFLDVASLEPDAEPIEDASDAEIAAVEPESAPAPEPAAKKKPAAKAKSAVKKAVAKAKSPAKKPAPKKK